MTRPNFRRLALGAIAIPLALGLAACGSDGSATGSGPQEPIAAIAPPAGKAWSEVVTKTPEGGFLMGNPDAPIKLVEYGSLTCPHCAAFTQESAAALRDTFVASGRVSFEFRNFVLNPLDLAMAMLVRCGAPESFFALTEQTYANQPQLVDAWTQAGEERATQAVGLPPEQRYNAIASLAGLDEFYASRGIAADQARTCLANGQAGEDLVKATQEQSEQHQITGTPSFLINGELVPLNTWPEIKARLETMGAR